MKKRQPHKNIPKGCFEEEQGQEGFYGSVSHLIRKNPSTNWTHIEGNLKPRLFDLQKINSTESWKKLLYNDYLTTYFFQCEKATKELFRNANGDLMFFCHKGKGKVLTEYGLLNYHKGQYILIPKSMAYVFYPDSSSLFFVMESLQSHFREPERGLLGRHGLYARESLICPNLKALQSFLKENTLEFKTINIYHGEEKSRFFYKECVFNVTDWQGDLFPFTLSMADIMPVMSHRVHLPPSIHSTFLTDSFIVCSFLPRPLEQDKDALKVPFYHQNIDYDEVIFYHAGDFFSRDNLHEGMISFHPAGFPHGPHPNAIKEVKNKTSTSEYAVMLDSKQPLKRDKSLKDIEVKDYWKSWQE